MATASDNVVVNVPNSLSALRLVLAIVVFVLIGLHAYIPALIIFVIAASTDWIDGWWARKYGQVTKLGRMFDPFVDKIIICGAFIYLAAEHYQFVQNEYPGSGITAWMATVVIGREMLVTAIRSFIEQQGGDFSAAWSGKLKMVFQCAAVVASLLALDHFAKHETPLPTWLYWGLFISVWTAVLSTIQSGVEYLFAAVKLLRV